MNVPGYAGRHHHPRPHLCSPDKQLLPPNCQECFCASPAGLAASEWNLPSNYIPLRLPFVAFSLFALSRLHILINLHTTSKSVSPACQTQKESKKQSIKVSRSSANIPPSGGTKLIQEVRSTPLAIAFIHFCN